MFLNYVQNIEHRYVEKFAILVPAHTYGQFGQFAFIVINVTMFKILNTVMFHMHMLFYISQYFQLLQLVILIICVSALFGLEMIIAHICNIAVTLWLHEKVVILIINIVILSLHT